MILKLYGSSFHSVQPNFNSRALTEIGFRRDREFSLGVEEFAGTYEKIDEKSLSPETEGDVHDHAEAALLRALEEGVEGVLAALGAGEVLVVESREGEDYPKTKDVKKNVVVDGESRLYFHWRVDPPLRLGVYRKIS